MSPVYHQNRNIVLISSTSNSTCQHNPNDTDNKKNRVKDMALLSWKLKNLRKKISRLRKYTANSSTNEKDSDNTKCHAS